LWRKEEPVTSDLILAEIPFRRCDPVEVIIARLPRLVEYSYVLNVTLIEVVDVERALNPYGPEDPVAHVLIETPASHLLHECSYDAKIHIGVLEDAPWFVCPKELCGEPGGIGCDQVFQWWDRIGGIFDVKDEI